MANERNNLIEHMKKLQEIANDVTSIMYSTAAADFIEAAISIINDYPSDGKLIDTDENSLHLQNVNRRVSGFVAMNKGEYDIENMSFYKTKKKAEREWGSKQDIVKIQVNFQHGG